MGDPGYSFYFILIRCPKVIQQPKVIQLTGDPGYSFYFMLIKCPKVIQQPKVIQLTIQLLFYAYSMSQNNSAA